MAALSAAHPLAEDKSWVEDVRNGGIELELHPHELATLRIELG